MSTFSARHEHCAVSMAMGYQSATGKVGVASVTCGPGFTQIMTALTTASRGRIPLVVFAGEAPIHAAWFNQALDQPPFAAACGAHYISAHSPQRMYQYVREAFYIARHERKPVVLGVPYDLQKQPLPNIGAVPAVIRNSAACRAGAAASASGRRGGRKARAREMSDRARRPRRDARGCAGRSRGIGRTVRRAAGDDAAGARHVRPQSVFARRCRRLCPRSSRARSARRPIS